MEIQRDRTTLGAFDPFGFIARQTHTVLNTARSIGLLKTGGGSTASNDPPPLPPAEPSFLEKYGPYIAAAGAAFLLLGRRRQAA